MANSPMSHSLSASDSEELFDDSLLASMILPIDSPISSPIQNGANSPPHSGGLDGPNSPSGPIEAAVRPKPRGRPKGSKNKPKHLPLPPPPIRAHVLEIQPGSDVVEMIQYFGRTQNAGVTVVNGVGRVRNVTVRNPDEAHHEKTLALSGAHEIISISGTHVGPAQKQEPGENEKTSGSKGGSHSNFSGDQSSYLVIQLAGPGGAIWGGVVIGKLVAISNVFLNVTTFANYEFHSLSVGDLDPAHQNSSTSAGGSSAGEQNQLGPGSSSSAGTSVDNGLKREPTATMMGRKRTRVSEF